MRRASLVLAAIVASAGTVFAQGPAAPVVRPSDTRPKHDDRKLAELGIRVYESKRLRLYTDIDPAIAKTLPPCIDAAYDAWVDYFGPLPPNRERTEFQVTGYLMSGKALFREAGLLPANLPDFVNGRHRGAEFWMLDQKDAYYRRHLLIHEATHCYMTILGGPLPPVWYMEGMAEHFATHRIDKDGKFHFREMPESTADYAGLGRITLVQRETAAGRGRPLDEVLGLVANDFLKNEAYAWSWALCALLDGHPRWKDSFKSLGGDLTYRGFDQQFHEAFGPHLAELRAEWILYVASLQEGFDVARGPVVFRAAKTLNSKATVDVDAAQGWQSSGVRVEAGKEYEITATGRVTLAAKPKPWISEPQGVSIRYFDGKPLGMLVGVVLPDSAAARDAETIPAAARKRFPLGRSMRLKPETSGVLYLRVNDPWSELSDNTGHYDVTLEAKQARGSNSMGP